ncbi:MAG: UDP-N-acetylmuramoyl-tripeptide--D-alanyl-D-alanine ligase, partial [Bianqueaceae bacterium]
TRPYIGVITNIGVSHIEKLGSREGILKAKLEILDYMDPAGLLLLNGDDPMLYGRRDRYPLKTRFYGFEAHNDARILNADMTSDGKLHIEAVWEGDRYDFILNTPGRHMAYNVMPAIMAATALGLTRDEILCGLERFAPTQMRLNVVKTPQYTLIDDSYNASPVSMKAALDTLATLPGTGRRVAILGDMFELGDYAVLGHREVGNHAASIKNLDVVLCAGSNASYIYQEAAESPRLCCYHFETLEDLKKNLFDILQKGDIILVKASRGMAFDEICQMIK